MRLFALGALIVFIVPILAHAQRLEHTVETIDGKNRVVYPVEINVTPQKLPVPALKYKLTYSYDQKEKENAAVAYNFAMRELTNSNYNELSHRTQNAEQEQEQLFTDPEFFARKKKEFEDFEKMLAELPDDPPKSVNVLQYEKSLRYQVYEYAHYADLPLEQFPFDKARKFVRRFKQAYQYIERGSRCDYCDWQYHIRGNRNFMTLAVPEIQECRGLAYGLLVKARVEIHDKKYDEAIKTIRVGKRLAQHVGGGETFLVAALVGVAIDTMMNTCLIELAQQSDAPNLYWTLTNLPSPAFSFDKSIQLEIDGIRIMFPEVAKAMDDPEGMSENDWKEFHSPFEKMTSELLDFVGDNNLSLSEVKILGKFWSITAYPKAKRWMLSQGKTAEEIEKMSVAKVLGLWSIYRYSIVYDNITKSVQVPYWQWKPYEKTDPIETDLQDVATPLDAIVNLLFPAYRAAHTALLRCDAAVDMMRIVEAIRLYAAENNGKLPETLDKIQLVPIPPIDPFSGKAYSYRIVDGAAFIETELPYGTMRFKVRISK